MAAPPTILFAGVGALLLSLVAGCGDRSTDAAPFACRYHDGSRWQERTVAPDRLRVVVEGGHGIVVPEPWTLDHEAGGALVGFPAVASMAELDAHAARLAALAGVRAVQPLLLLESGAAEALGRDIVLRAKPGSDAAAVASRHGLRLTRALTRPDSHVGEPIAPGLLAPLAVAQSLHDDAEVVSAVPQVARARTLRRDVE